MIISFAGAFVTGCGDDATSDGGSDATDGGDSTGDDDATGDESGDATGDGDGDGDGDATGDGDGDATGDGDGDATGDGYCAMGCIEDADCCPDGSLNCPSENYPDNYSCNDQGVCEFGGCSNNDDCTSNGLFPNMECHAISDQPTCFEPCANDTGCLLQPGTTCSGVADDGTMYCAAEAEAPCEDDVDCAGFGICDVDSGDCYCEQDGNCTANGVDTCVAN